MLLKKYASLIIALTLFSQIALSEYENEPFLNATEVSLTDFQKQTLQKDMPVADAMFDSQGQYWLLGKHYLWKWSPLNKTLQKIKLKDLPLDPNSMELLKLGQNKMNLFILANQGIAQVDKQSGKVRLVKLPYIPKIGFKQSRFVVEERGLLLTFNDGLHHYYDLGASAWKSVKVPSSQASDTSLLDYANKTLWFTKKGKLYRSDLKQKPKLILNSKYKILDIELTKQCIFAHTSFAVVRYDLNGKLVQVIPVNGKQRLLKFGVGEQQQAYLFSNRVLEIYDNNKEDVKRYKINLGKARYANAFHVTSKGMGLVTDGWPRYYALASWN